MVRHGSRLQSVSIEIMLLVPAGSRAFILFLSYFETDIRCPHTLIISLKQREKTRKENLKKTQQILMSSLG